jgi:hypothetical protein
MIFALQPWETQANVQVAFGPCFKDQKDSSWALLFSAWGVT